MSATPQRIERWFYLTISDGDTLETIRSNAETLRGKIADEGLDPHVMADCGDSCHVNLEFRCLRMETQAEADARENDPREIERTRSELERISKKYSLKDLQKL